MKLRADITVWWHSRPAATRSQHKQRATTERTLWISLAPQIIRSTSPPESTRRPSALLFVPPSHWLSTRSTPSCFLTIFSDPNRPLLHQNLPRSLRLKLRLRRLNQPQQRQTIPQQKPMQVGETLGGRLLRGWGCWAFGSWWCRRKIQCFSYWPLYLIICSQIDY